MYLPAPSVWSDAHAAEERMKRDGDAWRKGGGHRGAIEWNDFGAAVGEIVRQKAAARAEAVTGPGHVDLDLLNAHFKHIAGLGFGDGDRSGKNMAAGTAVGGGDVGVDFTDIVGDVGGFDSKRLKALCRPAGGERLNRDCVA